MDRSTAIFVDGLSAAAATAGILSQLQGRIFTLLYDVPDRKWFEGSAWLANVN